MILNTKDFLFLFIIGLLGIVSELSKKFFMNIPIIFLLFPYSFLDHIRNWYYLGPNLKKV